MRTFLAALALLLAACNTGSAVSGNWRVEIKTEGGLAGRGLGSAVLTSDHASEAQHRLVAAAKPSHWQAQYLEPGNPHGYADQVKYTLTLTRGDASYTSSWFDGSADLRPRDLARLFDSVWANR